MTDSHAHLNHPLVVNRFDEMMKAFSAAGGKFVLNNGTDIETSREVLDQHRVNSAALPAVALHPELIIPGTDIHVSSIDETWIDKNLEELNKLVTANRKAVVAIGECGLDYFWVKRERLENREEIYKLQRHMFSGLIKLAKAFDLPIIVHCRDEMNDKQAAAEALELLASVGNSTLTGIFHSYTGPVSYLQDIFGLGFFVSFNGIVTYKNAANVRELLDATPLENLLIETDTPYLAPQKRRSAAIKIAEPLFVDEVGEFIAQRRNMTNDALWKIVDGNFERLVGV